jgi:uncharacterized membrane protein YphA (DoxX/SURF4 family)
MSTDVAPNKSFTRFFPAIARVLLGLVFFVFGLNGFFFFIPPPPPDQMPKALMEFSTAMMNTGFLFQLVKGTEVLCGLLLLVNRFVPLALVVLAPVIVNIVMVHVFLAPANMAMAFVILALELYLAWAYRSAFRPMLAAQVTPG